MMKYIYIYVSSMSLTISTKRSNSHNLFARLFLQ